MNLTVILILVIIGLFTGAFAGVLGIGGGLIMIPALIFFLGYSQHQAIGTSLAVMLPPIGFFAAYNYYKAGFVDIKYSLIIAAAFMVGSFFTSKIAINIPENAVRKAFSVLLVIVAIKMFFSK
jgi:uncharacterized membrane protein YfcA